MLNCCLIRKFDSQEHTAAQVKAEIDMHLAEKEILEATIPSNIVVGAFWINTENVRQSLAKKRKALANAVLELLAKKLRTQADEVSAYAFLLLISTGRCMQFSLLFKRSGTKH